MLSWLCRRRSGLWASDVWLATPGSPSHSVTLFLDGPLLTKAPLGDVDSPPSGRGYFFPESLLFDCSCSTLNQYSPTILVTSRRLCRLSCSACAVTSSGRVLKLEETSGSYLSPRDKVNSESYIMLSYMHCINHVT